MRRFEVEIQHNFDNKLVGSYRFKSNKDKVVLGSSRDVNIRLLGEKVSGIHAMLEYTDDGWRLVDLCSEGGTWIRKKSVIEVPIHQETLCNIGDHVLKINPIEIKSELFKSETDDNIQSQNGNEIYHQVILRKSGYVVGTHLLKSNEPFIYIKDGVEKQLPPPKDHHWIKDHFQDMEISQRLVKTKKVEDNLKEKFRTLWDPNFKMPAIISVVLFFLVFGLINFYPNSDQSDLKEIKPIKNKYTKIIYDAKSTRKNREKAKKLKNKFVAKAPQSQKTTSKTPSKVKKSKTIVNISKNFKKSGLTQLIGKIAMRASKTATLIKTQGVKASQGGARSLVSSAKTKLKTKNTKTSGTFKLGAVSSIDSGSASQLKGMGGLAAGSVGEANVGIIEEDTMVEGGLAREVIAQTIQENIGQIRYCYERQLSANPDLYGKLSVRFTINASGRVETPKIATSTMNSTLVEGCVLRRVAKWQFPKPKGGTMVRVTYPFLFKSGN